MSNAWWFQLLKCYNLLFLSFKMVNKESLGFGCRLLKSILWSGSFDGLFFCDGHFVEWGHVYCYTAWHLNIVLGVHVTFHNFVGCIWVPAVVAPQPSEVTRSRSIRSDAIWTYGSFGDIMEKAKDGGSQEDHWYTLALPHFWKTEIPND